VALEIIPAIGESDIARFCSLRGPGNEDAAAIVRHGADAHWMAVSDGIVEARCSLWWSAAPQHETHNTGVVGHFAGAGSAAIALLDHACSELAGRDCTIAIGPMDGNTWRRYRVLTERNSSPPFFLELDNPDEWPSLFTDAGFHPMAEYYSARSTGLAIENPRAAAVWQRLSDRGFSIRRLDMHALDTELERLYDLALASFARNFLYTPIAREEFLAQYQAVVPFIRPELVLIAEHEGRFAGFVFALPDLLEWRRGGPVVTYIVKTLAVHPDAAGRGLGSVLLWQVNCAAAKLGYRAAIHALMHESNQSMKISAREGQVFRRYTLYARTLVPKS
jgi:GNAT superfamily N-acetyltransferase